MQPIRSKNQGGVFPSQESKIRIFSEDRVVRLMTLKADVFENLARKNTPHEENVVTR